MTDIERDAGGAVGRAFSSPGSGPLAIRAAAALEIVGRHEAAALAALEAATGGAPLCRVDGTQQTVKSSEGAAAALADVRRALRGRSDEAAGAAAVDDAKQVIDEVRERWASLGGALAARPGSDEYVAGGRDALAALEAELRQPGQEPSTVVDRGSTRTVDLVGSPVLGQLDGSIRGAAASATARWSPRRRAATAAILVGLVLLVGLTVGWPLADAPGWTVLTAGTVVLSSLALGLFIPQPGAGWRPDFGCAPCAVAGLAMAVAGPWLAIETAPQVERAALALVIAGAGLARKLTEPPVCPKR